jgi:hypothetical protein
MQRHVTEETERVVAQITRDCLERVTLTFDGMHCLKSGQFRTLGATGRQQPGIHAKHFNSNFPLAYLISCFQSSLLPLHYPIILSLSPRTISLPAT